MINEKYPNLFKPLRIGSVVAKNRINFEPTAISCSNADGSISELDQEVYGELAKGGFAMINIGGCTPNSKTGRVTVTGCIFDDDNMIPGMTLLANSIKKYGALAIPQIQHPGRQCPMPKGSYLSTNDMVTHLPWSAGHEVVFANSEEKGKEIKAMTTSQILDQIDEWSTAAHRALRAGFDGVCLHAAHGYLMSAFLSPYLNRRIDRFGGSFENRMLFPVSVVQQIKAKCGKDFPVMVRFSANEWVPGGIDSDEAIKIAMAFEEAGVDALDLSQCIQETPGAGFDPMQYDEGWTLYSAKAVKPHVNIPVIISHALRTPAFCDQIIGDGIADMIGMCRGALADPYWPAKVQYGKEDKIRNCISCLTGCWQESLMAAKNIACAINPICGDIQMYKNTKEPCKKSLKIGIVGGGPAGMEAARWAVLKGHKPVIFEKKAEMGGQMLGDCLVPGKKKMKWHADWLRHEMKDLGVEIKMETVPTAADLKKFDVVYNATGAVSYAPEYSGDYKPMTMEEAYSCGNVNCEFYPKCSERKPAKFGKKVLVWGDYYGACDLVNYLGAAGKDTYVVTPFKSFGIDAGVEVIHMYVLQKRMAQGDAEYLEDINKPWKYATKLFQSSRITNMTKTAKGVKVTIINNEMQLTEVEVDDVVACFTRPNDAMSDVFAKVEAAGIPVIKIGDADRVANLHHAIKTAADSVVNLDPDSLFKNDNDAMINDLPLDAKRALTGK